MPPDRSRARESHETGNDPVESMRRRFQARQQREREQLLHPTQRAVHDCGLVAEAAEARIRQLHQEMAEQKHILHTARGQAQALELAEAGIARDAPALERVLHRLQQEHGTSGGGLDIPKVMGPTMEAKARQIWGRNWDRSVNGRPPVKDVFRLTASDLVDVRQYLRQVSRNADAGQPMPRTPPPDSMAPLDGNISLRNWQGGGPAPSTPLAVPRLPLHALHRRATPRSGRPDVPLQVDAVSSDSGDIFDDV